jgi:hypothetical protein
MANASRCFLVGLSRSALSAAGCQKAVVAPLADYLRRVPELGPCFGNDHPDSGSMEARRSSGFYGCCRIRRHRGNFAGTHTGKTKAERPRYPIGCRNISIPLKTAAFRRSLMDGRQPFRYAPERPTTGKVRIARHPTTIRKLEGISQCSMSALAIWHQVTTHT